MYICTHVDIYIYKYIYSRSTVDIYIYIYEYMDMCRHITDPTEIYTNTSPRSTSVFTDNNRKPLTDETNILIR